MKTLKKRRLYYLVIPKNMTLILSSLNCIALWKLCLNDSSVQTFAPDVMNDWIKDCLTGRTWKYSVQNVLNFSLSLAIEVLHRIFHIEGYISPKTGQTSPRSENLAHFCEPCPTKHKWATSRQLYLTITDANLQLTNSSMLVFYTKYL